MWSNSSKHSSQMKKDPFVSFPGRLILIAFPKCLNNFPKCLNNCWGCGLSEDSQQTQCLLHPPKNWIHYLPCRWNHFSLLWSKWGVVFESLAQSDELTHPGLRNVKKKQKKRKELDLPQWQIFTLCVQPVVLLTRCQIWHPPSRKLCAKLIVQNILKSFMAYVKSQFYL